MINSSTRLQEDDLSAHLVDALLEVVVDRLALSVRGPGSVEHTTRRKRRSKETDLQLLGSGQEAVLRRPLFMGENNILQGLSPAHGDEQDPERPHGVKK